MDVLTIWESADCKISQARNVCLPGYLLVESRGGRAVCDRLDEALTEALRLAKMVVQRGIGPRRIYQLEVAKADTGTVFHVIPGTDEVLGNIAESVDSVDDGRKIADSVRSTYKDGGTIYGAVELINFVAEARHLCRELETGRMLTCHRQQTGDQSALPLSADELPQHRLSADIAGGIPGLLASMAAHDEQPCCPGSRRVVRRRRKFPPPK